LSAPQHKEKSSVELIDYVRIIRRRWALILVVLIACLAGSVGATKLQTPRYAASTRLLVSGSSSVSAIDEISRRQLAIQRATAFAQIAGTAPAVKAAYDAANAAAGPFHKAGYPSLSATADGTDPFIVIRVTDVDKYRAQAVANAVVATLPSVVSRLDQAPSATPEELSTLEPAGLPGKPYSPNPKKNLLLGFVVGLALGLGSGFVRETLDRRLRDSDDVERAAGVTMLGVVPTEISETRIPVQTHPMSMRAEAYRKVRTNLTFTTAHGLPKSLLITSAISGEGKTTLAVNLALACERTGQTVALVDADLRRPMVNDYLGLPATQGLTSILAGSASLPDVVQRYADTRVDVIASGPIPANPSELLGSERMTFLLDELQRRYDVVIVDAPPVLPVADALVIAVHTEAVVLVAKVGDTTVDRLRRAKDAVLKVNGNLVGVVPNAVVQREDSAYAYAYRYRSRKDHDSLKLYTKQARTPDFDELPEGIRPAGSQPLPAPAEQSQPAPKRTGTSKLSRRSTP
jgi:capsular exopolysaccharide synthesis family protein